MTSSPRQDSILTQTLFFLRFIQAGSLVLTGFVAIYFLYWHDVLKDPIPWKLVFLVTTCSLTFIENYITTGLSIYHRGTKPNHALLFKTSTPCTFLMFGGYYALRQIPYIRKWCEGDDRFVVQSWGPYDVEKHHCALTCTIIVAGAIAMSFTILISIFTCVAWCLDDSKEGGAGIERSVDQEKANELGKGDDLIDINSPRI